METVSNFSLWICVFFFFVETISPLISDTNGQNSFLVFVVLWWRLPASIASPGLLSKFVFWFIFLAEIPPPAPLQTQDGSAVAKNGHNGCFFLFIFWFIFFLARWLQAVPQHFFIYAKTINQPTTPSKRPTLHVSISQQLGIQRGDRDEYNTKLATSSTDTATLVCF